MKVLPVPSNASLNAWTVAMPMAAALALARQLSFNCFISAKIYPIGSRRPVFITRRPRQTTALTATEVQW
jgi:hypothetical protein